MNETRDPSPVPSAAAAALKAETIENNGISMRVFRADTEAFSDPSTTLVLLLHGWPETWYSWRHQIDPIARAGYRVVVPEMRGYGETEAPYEVEHYSIRHLANDVTALIERYSAHGRAIVIGHDWGSLVTWQYAMLEPARCHAVVCLSVPWAGRGPMSLTDLLRRRWQDDFFYILYFQEPDKAEAEFDPNTRTMLRRMYISPDTPCETPEITDPKRAAGGFLGRRGDPLERPDWLSEHDLDIYVASFLRSGFRGGINYYRNFDRNWEILERAQQHVTCPAFFLAGEKDGVLMGRDREALEAFMSPWVTDLRAIDLVPGVGHWVQQEAPGDVNERLLAYLTEIERSRGAG